MTSVNITQTAIEVLRKGTASVNQTQLVAEVLRSRVPPINLGQSVVEVLRSTLNAATGQNIVVDDLVSYSTDGSDTASTLVPPRSVWTSLPNAVGDQTKWSRVGGAVANWDSVNGQAYQTAMYNTTSQNGTLDYYNITDLPGAPTTIDGVVVTACARKEDSGSRNLKLHARVNGVDDVSSAITLTTGAAFWYLSATFPQAPGSIAWTASAINLCQLGLESA